MIRRPLAEALGAVCGWVDALPDWTWRIPLLHRLGCPWGLLIRASLWLDPLPLDLPTPDDRRTNP